jgi:hypothetical protein
VSESYPPAQPQPPYQPPAPWQPPAPQAATPWAPPAAYPSTDPMLTPDAPPARKRPRWLLPAIGAAAVLLAVGGAVFALTPGDKDLTVTMQLVDIGGDVSCADGGSGGYSDIGPGMPIVVKDEAGTIIGSGSLPSTGEEVEDVGCEWTVHIQVPEDAKQYAVEGGDRGAVTFSRQELEDNGWEAGLSLGS